MEINGAPCQPEKETAATNDSNFDSQKANQKRHNNPPLVEQKLQIQTCACCHKEQAQQNPAEWPNIRFNLANKQHNAFANFFIDRQTDKILRPCAAALTVLLVRSPCSPFFYDWGKSVSPGTGRGEQSMLSGVHIQRHV